MITLIKKEHFILKCECEIREVMRIGTVFEGFFWNEGVVHSELNMALQIIMKRGTAIRRHFKNDPLFGAKFISVVDNHNNLLLNECEGVFNPKNILSYFSINQNFNRQKVVLFSTRCLEL